MHDEVVLGLLIHFTIGPFLKFQTSVQLIAVHPSTVPGQNWELRLTQQQWHLGQVFEWCTSADFFPLTDCV